MTKSVQTSSIKFCTPDARITVEKIAQEAAELSKRHRAQFANLAALARTIQSYIPMGKQQCDYALLASALVDSAEHYKSLADVHDVAFSLVATSNLNLLDPAVRADILRRAKTNGKPNSKQAKARTSVPAAHH